MDSKQIYSPSSFDKYRVEFCRSLDREGNMDINEQSMTIHHLNTSQSLLPCGSAESERQLGDRREMQREDSLNGLYVRYYCFNYDNAFCGGSTMLGRCNEPLKMEDLATYPHAPFVGLIYIFETGN